VALSSVAKELQGEVAVVGAPAEETFGGKVVLAREGGFEHTDVALLAHPGDADRAIVPSNASWSFEVCFEGRSAHAVASPESGVNALDAMVQLFNGRDMLLKALGAGVSMPGVILEGGVRPNVIPDRARAHFSLRAASSEVLVSKVVARFRDLVEGVARATGVGVRMESIDNLYDELLANPVLAEIWVRKARESGSECELRGTRPIGSLDVGTLSWRVPTLHPFFSIVDEATPTHSPEFTQAAIDARALDATVRATRTLAMTALEVLASPSALERVRAAHEPPAADERGAVEAPLVTRGLEP
jgi:amidohydrolase